MKILLINSPLKGNSGNEHLFRYPPLGLLYIAAYLESKSECDVRVIDASLNSSKNIFNVIHRFVPDVVGVTFTTISSSYAFELVKRIKSEFSLPVVIGGPHATALPRESIISSSADIAVIGEGEETFNELINELGKKSELKSIKGIAYRKNGDVVITPKRSLISDLDNIPFPARYKIKIDDYPGYPLRKGKETTILTSRGCPNNCFFCANSVWKNCKPWLRFRSPENIADELISIRDEYNLEEFYEYSDEFNFNERWSIDVCKEILDRRVDMHWKCQLYPTVSKKLAKAMSDSGCWFSLIGIESGNIKTLKGVGKKHDLGSVIRSCRNLKKNGIKIQGNFMLFNVWEEDNRLKYEGIIETKNTLKFARKLIKYKLIDYCSFQITTPYPGSQLFDFSRKKGKIFDDYSDMDSLNNQVFAFPDVSDKQIYSIKREADILQSITAVRSGSLNLKYVYHFSSRLFNDIKHSLVSRNDKRDNSSLQC